MTTTIQPALLRPKDAADFLAIGVRLLWERTNCGEIPAVRIGRCVRYDVDQLRKWIASKMSKETRRVV